jgi:hypothetical protein
VASGWHESYSAEIFEIRHRLVGSVARPWYCYSNLTAECGVTFYRQYDMGLHQQQQQNSVVNPVMVPDCGGLCLLQLSTRYVRLDGEVFASLTLKGLRRPLTCAYVLLLKAEYVGLESSADRIVRAHRVFGAQSQEVLAQLPDGLPVSFGYVQREDEWAIETPTPLDVVVRGSKISFCAPILFTGGGAVAADGQGGEGYSSDGSNNPSSQHSSSPPVLTPSIDTGKTGLTFSRAPGPVERIEDSSFLQGAGAGGGAASVGSRHPSYSNVAGSTGGFRRQITSTLTPFFVDASGSGDGHASCHSSGVSPSLSLDDYVLGTSGDPSTWPSPPPRPTSPRFVGPGAATAAAVAAAAAGGDLGLPPAEPLHAMLLRRAPSTDSSEPTRHRSLSSSSSSSFSSSVAGVAVGALGSALAPSMSPEEVEAFNWAVYEDSVSVRYHLRLIVQDASRALHWTSTEIVLLRPESN